MGLLCCINRKNGVRARLGALGSGGARLRLGLSPPAVSGRSAPAPSRPCSWRVLAIPLVRLDRSRPGVSRFRTVFVWWMYARDRSETAAWSCVRLYRT